jgi:methylenetetrahydrofolate dehydrogenase (NADP+)/methenyltetrahydrofolate cyclohydrolase
MVTLLNGKLIGEAILEEAKTICSSLSRRPHLAILLIGDNPDSLLYIKKKEEAAAQVGIAITLHHLPEATNFDEARARIEACNADASVDAILVQIPLPQPLDQRRNDVVACIAPEKDVDGFHPTSMAEYMSSPSARQPVLMASISRLLTETGVDFAGKSAVVLGNTDIFTKPLSVALERLGLANVEWVGNDANTTEARAALLQADVVVSAIGRPGMLRGEHFKSGAVVIDVGTRRVDGRTRGDVDADSAKEVVGFLTPVPGGVGPVTVGYLMKTTALISAAFQARQ